MIDLAERCLRIQPLRVLLVAVEDEWCTDVAVVDQLLHVLHRRAVAKRESELGLYALPARQLGRAKGVLIVVGHRLLAEHVLPLPLLERRPGQIEVCRARRADIHEIDVVARDERFVRIVPGGDPEFLGEGLGAFGNRIGDCDELATRVALISGQVRELRPGTGAQHADAYLATTDDSTRRHQSMTDDVSPGSSSMRCALIGAMPFVMNRSWKSRRLNFEPRRAA